MLILPPGHTREVSAGRRLSPRERRLVRVMATVTVVLIIGVIVSLTARGASSGHGCVHATYAGPVGAEQISRCGAAARQLCASLDTPGELSGDAARTVAIQCRKAGLPVGRSA